MNKLLTIVVPVYKVELYINKCLDSCLIYKTNEQGEKVLDEEIMSQLEVIIVNDGTPDQSAEMSREYVRRYPQTFRQIDKENGGHGSAWNVGLKEATGKYLRFLDSDDWLTNLERFMKDLESCDTDLVFTHLDKFMAKEGKFVRFSISGVYNRIMNVDEFDYSANGDYTMADFQYCTYKTALFKPLWPLFDEHCMYDDMILHIAPQLLGETYIIYDYVLYNYLIGRDGQTMSPEIMERNCHFLFQEYKKIISFYQKYRESHVSSNWAENVIISHITGYQLKNLLKLPYGKFHTGASEIKRDTRNFTINSKSKQWRRFNKYPLWMFFLLEKVRSWKNG